MKNNSGRLSSAPGISSVFLENPFFHLDYALVFISKAAIVDFLVSDTAFGIVNKSAWHMNTILMFSNKESKRHSPAIKVGLCFRYELEISEKFLVSYFNLYGKLEIKHLF